MAGGLHWSILKNLHSLICVELYMLDKMQHSLGLHFYVSTEYFRKERENCCIALLFYVNGKHLRSCRDGQLT